MKEVYVEQCPSWSHKQDTMTQLTFNTCDVQRLPVSPEEAFVCHLTIAACQEMLISMTYEACSVTGTQSCSLYVLRNVSALEDMMLPGMRVSGKVMLLVMVVVVLMVALFHILVRGTRRMALLCSTCPRHPC